MARDRVSIEPVTLRALRIPRQVTLESGLTTNFSIRFCVSVFPSSDNSLTIVAGNNYNPRQPYELAQDADLHRSEAPQ